MISPMRFASPLILSTLLFGYNSFGSTADWRRFRGIDGAGVSDSSSLPSQFGPANNVAWKTAVPDGCSSPVVSGDRIWLAGYESSHRYVLCLDLNTGRQRWQRSVEATVTEHKSKPNDPASSTPVTDGQNVYALFSGFGLISFDRDGQELWRVPLGPFTAPHGMASSPILAGNLVIVLADQIRDSYVAAFDAANGKRVWQTARPSLVGGYSTPILWRDEVLVPGPLELAAYAVATGTRVWSVPKMGVMPIGSPALVGDRIFVNNGAVPPFEALKQMQQGGNKNCGKITPDEFPDPSYKEAVRAIDQAYGNGDGAIDQAEWDGALKLMNTLNTLVAVHLDGQHPSEIWRSTKLLADVASPIICENILYLLKDGGLLCALNPDSGDVLWRERVSDSGRYFASPIAGDKKLFVIAEDGKATVIRTGKNFSPLATNDLGEECYATPAIAKNLLLVRTLHTLWAFGGGGFK